jgi:RND family efflux transporter MFP subunit
MKNRVLALVLAAVVGLTATACGSEPKPMEVPKVTVSGILPAQGDVIVSTAYIGTVAPQESVTVYPLVSGNVTQLNVNLSQQVKAGDALFNVDNTEATKAVTEAQQEYDTIKKAADQAKKDAEAAEKEAADAKKNAASTTLELIKTHVNNSINDMNDAKGYLNDAKDELERLENGESGSLSLTSSERTKLKQFVEDAQGKVNTVEGNLTTVETRLAELEIAEAKLSLLKTNLTEAKKKLGEARTSLNSAKARVESSMSESSRKGFKDDVRDVKDDIEKITTSINQVKTNLPTTATTKKTTSTTNGSTSTTNTGTASSNSTTTSSVNISTTVETAYDQQLLLAEKKLNEAKALLELYQVKAPFDGVIEAVYIDKNQKVFEDSPCVVISNRSYMEVTFQVPEAVAKVLNTGEKVIVDKDGSMNEANITEIAVMGDPETKLFTIKASLGAVTEFSTGSTVKVYAETQKALNVMKIPYDALYFQSGAAYVYCIEDDEAVRKEVQVGLMNDESAEILNGLEEHDIVISTWSSQLKDGAEVNLLFVIGYEEPVVEEENPADVTLEGTPEPTETDDLQSEGTGEEYTWVLPELQ